jgi:transcriptional regulator with XRE-family HTH domain
MLRTFERQMADYARGELLRGLRKRKRLSQEDAAHEIGVTSKSLREWEHGGPIKWKNAQAVGKFYNVDAERLVTRDLEEPVEDDRVARIEAKLDALLAAAGIDVTPLRAAEQAAKDSMPAESRQTKRHSA